jgi:hypothetical protein
MFGTSVNTSVDPSVAIGTHPWMERTNDTPTPQERRLLLRPLAATTPSTPAAGSPLSCG